jgi:hypothetical protein
MFNAAAKNLLLTDLLSSKGTELYKVNSFQCLALNINMQLSKAEPFLTRQ